MKPWLTRLVAIAVVVVVAFFVWQKLFPSTEKIIHGRIDHLAKLISFTSTDGNLARAGKVTSLLGYFTEDVECIIDTPDIPEAGDWTVKGRSDLRDLVLAGCSNFASLRAEFIDVTVVVAPDKRSATAGLTARVSLPRDRDFMVHEMKFTFQNVNGSWLISRVETVKTLM